MEAILYLNSNVFEVLGVKNAVDDTFINSATVKVTLTDKEGGNVSGHTWPRPLTYVGGTDGDYRTTLSETLGVTINQLYFAIVTVDGGAGLQGRWKLTVSSRERTSAEAGEP